MKSTFRIFLLTLFVIVYITVVQAQTSKLNSVKVESEGFSTETFYDVSCEAFDHTFKDTKKTKRFFQKDELSEFSSLTKDFKPLKNHSLDVRGSITYYYGRNSIKYCFDVFGVFYKDGHVFYNKKLLIYLTDKLDGNHPEYLDTLRQQ